MRRHILGISSIVLLISAVLLFWSGAESANAQALLGACSRVGILAGVLWMAWPELSRLPGWILGVIPAMAILLAWKPRYFLLLLPVLILMVIINPNRRKRKTDR